MTVKKLRPVIRMPGSKYLMLPHLLPHFGNPAVFVDVFAGTGIVGLNVKLFNPGTRVIINDFDRNLIKNVTSDRKLVDNMLRFDGVGVYSKGAALKFLSRVKFNYWSRVDRYRSILKQVDVLHFNYDQVPIIPNATYYLDPPYPDSFVTKYGLYKNGLTYDSFYKWSKDLAKRAHRVVITLACSERVTSEYTSPDWKIKTIERTNKIGGGTKQGKRQECIITSQRTSYEQTQQKLF